MEEASINLQTFTIIPIKGFKESKRRLSTVLSENQRKELVISMLSDVLRSVTETKSITETVVISPDPEILNFAERWGIIPLLEKGPPELNKAIVVARQFCMKEGAEAILVIPADIPLLKATDLSMLLKYRKKRLQEFVIICPSRNNGTNALLLCPGNVIEPSFGEDSFTKHCEKAIAKNVPLKIVKSERISLDVDSPEIFKEIFRNGKGTKTFETLKKILNSTDKPKKKFIN